MSKSYHAALEAAGHKLIRDEDGEVDVFIMDAGYHNGPDCELCGDSWCHHCEPTITPCPSAKSPAGATP